jgi:cell division protein FtsZ
MMNRREFILGLLGGGAIIGAGLRPPKLPDEDVYYDALRSCAAPEPALPFRVIGIGGGGCNIVHKIAQSKRQDVQVIAVNTYAGTLERIEADEKILIGSTLLNGQGAHGNPELGRKAALEDLKRIAPLMEGAGTVVVVAGLGGGTGSGAIAPVVRLARKMGAFVPVVVTTPFSFEGERRQNVANKAIGSFDQYASTTVLMPCDRLLSVAAKRCSIADTFTLSDRLVIHAVKVFRDAVQGGAAGIGISREDMESLFKGGSGRTVMGMGSGRGEMRGAIAALNASYSPMVDRRCIDGARSAYIHIEGGNDLTLGDVNDAGEAISKVVSTTATILFGVVLDPALNGSVDVTVLAAGFPGGAGGHSD